VNVVVTLLGIVSGVLVSRAFRLFMSGDCEEDAIDAVLLFGIAVLVLSVVVWLIVTEAHV
jgi:hypothetical protein